MANRYLDAGPVSPKPLPPLPIINWSLIGEQAPTVVDLGAPSKEHPLPKADVVVITWTVAEWSALDHVFVNSNQERTLDSNEFHKDWHYRANESTDIEEGHYLWGFYRMVKITNANGVELDVLLLKSSSHLAHTPYGKGLEKMVEVIIEESKPQQLYTIGTAGGASVKECLGDVVFTNCGIVKIEKEENTYLDGQSVSCDTWFPALDFFPKVEEHLLFKLSTIVNEQELEDILQETIYDPEKGNPAWAGTCTIADLTNEAIDPTNLEHPKGLNKKDVKMLTTDFYYIAKPDDGEKYAALEMDDTVVGLVAKRMDTDFVFVRNISDPVVPFTKKDGSAFPEGLRDSFSGKIYEHFGLYSSMNGALLTWATIAGDTCIEKETHEMTEAYNPPRQISPVTTGDPMEIELVLNVRSCGTCSFFWPDDPRDQSYGPYPIFDFTKNFPNENKVKGTPEAYSWVKGVTRTAGFPNGEVMDGCRKTPIMTIGINPNMTAFAPGIKGTSWAYPLFTSDDGTDGFAKYAYYYRYRNVYQERFDFDFIKEYLLNGTQLTVTKTVTATQDQLLAAKDGKIVSAERPGAGPTFDLVIQYEGDDNEITITLERKKGEHRYVVLFDHQGDHSTFKSGDIIAGKLDVPADVAVEIFQELQTYYEQFVPSLNDFSDFLKTKGHRDANLRIGEDVGQLDMVACASPHWKPSFLGGSRESENLIINNCVSKNAWAMKQLIMTRPAVLYLVGESSFNMFNESFGHCIYRKKPLPSQPSDYAYTLFKETIDDSDPTLFKYETTIDGKEYKIETRLIVTPHFSFSNNFLPQIRLYKAKSQELTTKFPACFEFLKSDERITADEPDNGYFSYAWSANDNDSILKTLQTKFADCWAKMDYDYYNPHAQMAQVLKDMYSQGKLSYTYEKPGASGYLTRSEGGCRFCVNKHWAFPEGCPYDKTKEAETEELPANFLSQVVAEITEKGKKQKPKTMNTSFEIPPNAVRVWRGFRQPEKKQADFFTLLEKTFIPSTVLMQIKNGLDTYIPAVPCGLAGKPDTVPDETAILFWDSQQTYEDGFKTLAGRTYTLTHGGVYTQESGANFPELFTGKIALNTCYYLINKSTDWMHGNVKHLVADASQENLKKYTSIITGIQQRGQVDGAIVCIGDNYIVYWQLNGESDPGFDQLKALSDWTMIREPKDYHFPKGSALWDEWEGMEVSPGDAFNMQFTRRFEMQQSVPPQPVAPDSVHVWRGFKKGTSEEFADFLGHVFLPAGSLLQPNAGLHAFFPSLPVHDGKPTTIPDQTALMFWTNQQTYKDGFNKMAVRAYTNLHGDLYDTTKSKSGFPIYLEDEVKADQPYFLINKPADWMLGNVQHLVGQRKDNQNAEDFLTMIGAWANHARTNKAEGLEGAILCSDGEYVVVWMCWKSTAEPSEAIKALAAEVNVWLDMDAEKYEMPVGLWDNWVKSGQPAGIPQHYPSSLSIQLKRPNQTT